MLVLSLAAAILRFHRLGEVPFSFSQHEAAQGVNALEVLQGEHAVYFPENEGREGLYVYAVALAVSILGRTILAVRLPGALAGAATIFATFWVGWLFFGNDQRGTPTPWRGLFVGAVSAGLLATSMSQTIVGRTALRANFLPLLLSLSLALLWSGWRQRSWWRLTLAGVCAGLLPYSSVAARFALILYIVFGLSLLLTGTRKDGRNGSESGRLSIWHDFASSAVTIFGTFPWISIFLGTAAVVATPMLVYYTQHPGSFWGPSQIHSCGGTAIADGPLPNPLRSLVGNLWVYLLTFGYRGDPNWTHNIGGQPLLNPLEATFFWVGVVAAASHWRQQPACRLLVFWLGLLLLPAMLVEFEDEPFTPRMLGAVPAAYLLIAVGMWEAIRALRKHAASVDYSVFHFFHENRIRFAIALGMVLGGLTIARGANTYRTYFQEWAVAPVTDNQFVEALLTSLSRKSDLPRPDTGMVYLLPGRSHSEDLSWNCTFRYLYPGTASGYILNVGDSRFPQIIRSRLAALEQVSLVRLLDWDSDSFGTQNDSATLDFLLRKYGRYAGSDELEDFRVHDYVDISLQQPWTFYEQLESRTVHYEGGISLHGIALGSGEDQLSVWQPIALEQGSSLWVVLQWKRTTGAAVDFSTSLRLTNSEGEGVYQKDGSLLSTTIRSPDSSLLQSGMLYSLHYLDVPADLASGAYELRLIVYASQRLTPMLELGVWEPEKVVARFRLTGW